MGYPDRLRASTHPSFDRFIVYSLRKAYQGSLLDKFGTLISDIFIIIFIDEVANENCPISSPDNSFFEFHFFVL